MDKNTITTFMNLGRSCDSSTANAVYTWLYVREAGAKHTSQGIASSVFGQMNALLIRGGHLGFTRDQRDRFNAWVGLPPVGSKTSAASDKADSALASLGL